MKTKKSFLLLILFLSALVFSSCEKDDDKTFLFLGKTKIEFGYNTNANQLTISNIADKPIEWSVISTENYFSFSENSGMLDANDHVEITIGLLRSEIAGDSLVTTLTFKSSIGQDINMEVIILNYPENKIRVPYLIKDVAHDPDRQLLFLTCEYDRYVDVFDMAAESFERMDLSIDDWYYSVLELMPDGNHLVIVSSGNIYFFDAGTGALVNSHQFNDYIFNVAPSSDQKIYFTTTDWSPPLYTYDLITQQLTQDFINTGALYLRAHPSGKYLYGSINYGEMKKIDIQGDTPQVVHSYSQYSGADKFWITNEGNTIITSKMDVFFINPDLPGNDITGSVDIDMPGMSQIVDAAFDGENDEYYLIYKSNGYYDYTFKLEVFDGDMNHLHTITPEPFLANGNGSNGDYQSVPAVPYKVIRNEKDNSMVLITRPQEPDYSTISAIEIISTKKK
jgi:hypothetical protein